MKCRDIGLIEYDECSYRPRKLNTKRKACCAFDTETINGKAFLLGYYKDDKYYGTMHVKDQRQILDFLMTKTFQQSHNFFYNLTFDAQAIFKHFDYDNLQELARIGMTSIIIDKKRYDIKYLPGKLLKVSIDKHTSKFYDIAQFYEKVKLEKAAELHLDNELKIELDDDIDIKSLDEDRYINDDDYKSRLNKYCLQDAKLTKLLAEKLVNLTMPYIVPKYFYSNASFSQQYFLEGLRHKMRLPPKPVLDYALKAYQGGRFETFRRGSFKNSYIYDIKSAYPYHNTLVPNLSKGRWLFNRNYMPDALVSIIRCQYEIPKMIISPGKYQTKTNLLIYPYGKYDDSYLNKAEFELMSLYCPVNIIGAWHYFDSSPEYPFRWLLQMFNLKEQFKREKKDELAMIPKTMMNGFYGKTIQINDQLKIYPEKLKPEYDPFLCDIILSPNDEGVQKLHYVYKSYKAGQLFNPVIANEITANTRVQLFKSAMNCMENVIAFQTDSIIIDREMTSKELDIGDQIGQWSLDKSGDLLILGSGVYSMPGKKTRMRGFRKGIDLKDVINMDNLHMDRIEMELMRNSKLKRVMTMLYDSKDAQVGALNLITKEKRIININFDNKRIWDRNFRDVEDAMHAQINSWPLRIASIK
jgi:hypothetical protein